MSGIKKYLFIDRDGTLIHEPEDYQVDALDKVTWVDHVIPSLLKLKQAGYRFVMVSNQDGLGTDSFPEDTFWPAHKMIQQVLSSQGIEFEEELIDPTLPEDNAPTRKPGVGMVLHYLSNPDWDRERSWVIGDRRTDLELAENMGIPGFQLGEDGDWLDFVHRLLQSQRRAQVQRDTKETQIQIDVNLDQGGPTIDGNGARVFRPHARTIVTARWVRLFCPGPGRFAHR